MQSFQEPATSTLPSLDISLPVAAELTIGMATFPLLAMLVSGRAIAAGLGQLGSASEEIFRGEQLPCLPLLPLPPSSFAKR